MREPDKKWRKVISQCKIINLRESGGDVVRESSKIKERESGNKVLRKDREKENENVVRKNR